MPRNAGTGVYTRVVNSFSQPVFGTLMDPTDADAYFDDLDVGLNPPSLAGPVNIVGGLTGPVPIASSSANALTVGLNGATNPALDVDASVALQAAGVKILGAVTGGTVKISTIDSGAATNLQIDSKGGGQLTLNATATGPIVLTRATTLSQALTYGGVTLTNAVTGTGPMVLATSPALLTPTGIVKGDVGLGNVANVDTTNASNISSGTLPAARLPLTNAVLQTNITAPTGTVSTAGVMAGLGTVAKLTPVYSTRIMITFQGAMSSSVPGANAQMQLRFGTGTAPANGAALTGTVIGGFVQNTSSTASGPVLLFLSGIATGLTPGTAYWMDMAIASSSGASTANYATISCSLMEF